ncbi:MAG: RluA family pseudouridine synthase [bacterium]|nr:RluA family pseudouridine synthase [bacterium]
MKFYDIVHDDDEFFVINKPAGVVVHAGAGVQTKSLVDALTEDGIALADMGDPVRRGIIHRLDRDTYGLMVIAKTVGAYEAISAQFRERTVTKGYYAVVYGDIVDDELILDTPMGRDRNRRYMRSTVSYIKGTLKEAYTTIQVIKRYNTKTWVRALPKTGRTHQIRVHLTAAGFPVIGDPLYMDIRRRKQKKGKERPTGQLLQSYLLHFDHPARAERLEFELPVSKRLGVS